MGNLRNLQSKYGPQGLEVLGIATEDYGTFEQQRDRIIRVCHRHQTLHRILLNSGPQRADLLHKFNVNAFPTMILFDEQGNELWRHVGQLSASDLATLESFFRRQLVVR